MLVLPAYWWHEVITEGADGGGASGPEALTVSLNFWFTVCRGRVSNAGRSPTRRSTSSARIALW